MLKIGLFGGTFNPIHHGHTSLSVKVLSDFQLDKLYLIPSYIPPHKETDLANCSDRLAMLSIAIDKLDKRDMFYVSDVEINRKGKSYTIDTVKYFREIYPGEQIFFIVGSDIFATIDTWKDWKEILLYVNFIVVNRSSISFNQLLDIIPCEISEKIVELDNYAELKDKFGRVILYKMKEIDVSSTEVREQIYRDDDIEGHIGMIDKEILTYIKENEIYKRKL